MLLYTYKTHYELSIKTMSLDIYCPEFDDGDDFPSKYSASGDNVNPPLVIDGIPDDTETLVLIFEDLDSSPPGFLHWMVWNISPDIRKIVVDEVPEDAVEGYNDAGFVGYHGPKPEINRGHRVQFHLYALDTDLELDEDVTKAKLEKEIAGHILDEATVTAQL